MKREVFFLFCFPFIASVISCGTGGSPSPYDTVERFVFASSKRGNNNLLIDSVFKSTNDINLKFVKRFGGDGKLMFAYHTYNGKFHGDYKSYDPYGKVSDERVYDNGKLIKEINK